MSEYMIVNEATRDAWFYHGDGTREGAEVFASLATDALAIVHTVKPVCEACGNAPAVVIVKNPKCERHLCRNCNFTTLQKCN